MLQLVLKQNVLCNGLRLYSKIRLDIRRGFGEGWLMFFGAAIMGINQT